MGHNSWLPLFISMLKFSLIGPVGALEIVPVSFWLVLIVLWALPYFLVHTHTNKGAPDSPLDLTLEFAVSPRNAGSFWQRMAFRCQDWMLSVFVFIGVSLLLHPLSRQSKDMYYIYVYPFPHLYLYMSWIHSNSSNFSLLA